MEHFKARRHEQAVPGFRVAHRLFPRDADLHFWYALALARSDDLEAGKQELVVVANGPAGEQHPEAMLELGLICRVQKSPVAARAWFTRYIATMEKAGRGGEPGVKQARDNLVRLDGGVPDPPPK